MCKSEIFAETINLVSQETEIPAERILSPDRTFLTRTVEQVQATGCLHPFSPPCRTEESTPAI